VSHLTRGSSRVTLNELTKRDGKKVRGVEMTKRHLADDCLAEGDARCFLRYRSRVCVGCSGLMHTGRSDTATCSAACRQFAKRNNIGPVAGKRE